MSGMYRVDEYTYDEATGTRHMFTINHKPVSYEEWVAHSKTEEGIMWEKQQRERQEAMEQHRADPQLNALIGLVNKMDKLEEDIDKLEKNTATDKTYTLAHIKAIEHIEEMVRRNSMNLELIHGLLKPMLEKKAPLWKRLKWRVGAWVTRKGKQLEDECYYD